MDSLEAAIRKAVARKVVEDFKDPLGPLKAMTEAAYASLGQPLAVLLCTIMSSYNMFNV